MSVVGKFIPKVSVGGLGEKAKILAEFLREHSPRVGVITGAGISTSSGIPCYRGELGSYNLGHVPLQHAEFVDSASKRRRYWARSMRGFNYFHKRPISLTHELLVSSPIATTVSGIVTQNVDRLHHAAGSENVVELHGRGDRVVCLSCGEAESRKKFTDRMMEANREWIKKSGLIIYDEEKEHLNDDIRADGDAHLQNTDFADFFVPPCRSCGHDVVMPDLVFFGGTISKEVKQAAAAVVDNASCVLILGSSCSTFSAFSLVRRARDDGKPIAMVNIGETRVDEMVEDSLKFEYPVDEFLDATCEELDMHSY